MIAVERDQEVAYDYLEDYDNDEIHDSDCDERSELRRRRCL